LAVHSAMASLQKSLLPGEEVVFRARLSALPLVLDGLIVAAGVAMGIGGVLTIPTSFVVGGYVLAVAGGVVLLVGAGRMLRTLVLRNTTDMVVTNRRVLLRTGVLNKATDEMFLNKIESVEVDQNIWGRLLNYGTVEVNGSGEGELFFRSIGSPKEFRLACMAAVEQASAPRTTSTGSGVAPAAAGGPVFEVQVLDAPGAIARWVEVRAGNAEQAKALAAATGVQTGDARLKRIG